MITKEYNQEEGINFDDIFAPMSILETIYISLAFACYIDFKLFQIDVKYAFLNGFRNKEVNVKQPLGFENAEFSNHVFKLHKARYDLKQAPRAWYERLGKNPFH